MTHMTHMTHMTCRLSWFYVAILCLSSSAYHMPWVCKPLPFKKGTYFASTFRFTTIALLWANFWTNSTHRGPGMMWQSMTTQPKSGENPALRCQVSKHAGTFHWSGLLHQQHAASNLSHSPETCQYSHVTRCHRLLHIVTHGPSRSPSHGPSWGPKLPLVFHKQQDLFTPFLSRHVSTSVLGAIARIAPGTRQA